MSHLDPYGLEHLTGDGGSCGVRNKPLNSGLTAPLLNWLSDHDTKCDKVRLKPSNSSN